MRELRGTGASSGIGIGPAFVFMRAASPAKSTISPEAAPAEVARLEAAVVRAKEELTEVSAQLTRTVGLDEARMFDAHLLMLDDPELLGRAERTIQHDLCQAEQAIAQAAEDVAATLEALPDEYLRARAVDVRDVAERVRSILAGASTHPLASLAHPVVVVAEELLPSDTITVDRRKVLGFVTELGSTTAHAAILARAMGIPAVVGVQGATAAVRAGDTLVVDGGGGTVIVSPEPDLVRVWEEKRTREALRRKELEGHRDLPAETADGHRIEIGANIGSLADIKESLGCGAEEVGLFRTEFLFLDREVPPAEDEQFEVYRGAAEAFAGRPVIIRTLDVGGDKPITWLGPLKEANPFLGLRGLRLCLRHEDVFLSQLQALLRASVHGNVWVMLPMVADAGEVVAAKRLLREAQQRLSMRGVPYKHVPVGIMIEVPSAAVMADTLFDEVDFFSVGTNDLTQYALAVDRTNARVAYLADALHPAVLRLIAAVTLASGRKGKWVGVCGELAGDPTAAPLLAGLGVNELSMSASLIPAVKAALRSASIKEAREIATLALACRTASDVRALLTVGGQARPQAAGPGAAGDP